MRNLILATLILTAGANGPAQAQRCRATDGDTIICGSERIRIMGLDAPEMRGRCTIETRLARAARARMQQLATDGLTIERRGRDRYRRTLAVVRSQGQDVAPIMIAEGLARPYAGRRRQGWC